MQIKGIIQGIEQSKNPKVFKITIGGELYSIYEETGVCRFNISQQVDLEWEPSKDMKYKNIVQKKDVDCTEDDKKHNVIPIQEVEDKAGPDKYQEREDRKQDEKVKGVALSYAKDIAVAQISKGEKFDIGLLRNIAKDFESFIKGDKEVEDK